MARTWQYGSRTTRSLTSDSSGCLTTPTPTCDQRRRVRTRMRITTFLKAFRVACTKAGCPGRIPHDLRRTAVRNLVRAGVPERVAMQMTGHKTRSVFERYNIVSECDLLEAAKKLNAIQPASLPPAFDLAQAREGGSHTSESPTSDRDGSEQGFEPANGMERAAKRERNAVSLSEGPEGSRREAPTPSRQNWRRRPDLNRGWRFCRPLPYHLATAPIECGCCRTANTASYQRPPRRSRMRQRCGLHGRESGRAG